eukprot:3306935-Prymnesium_polylepis.1
MAPLSRTGPTGEPSDALGARDGTQGEACKAHLPMRALNGLGGLYSWSGANMKQCKRIIHAVDALGE